MERCKVYIGSNVAPTAWAGGKSGFYSEFQFILVANSIKDDTGRKESLGRCKSDGTVRGHWTGGDELFF